MKRSIVLTLFVASLTMLTVAQQASAPPTPGAVVKKSPLADYAGAWIGALDNHPYVLVRLNLEANQITGSMLRPKDLQYNNNGSLKSVSDEKLTLSIDSAVIQGDGMLLTVKDPNSKTPDHYVLRLTGATTAELKMVAMSMPPGMPKPQPWKLMKVTPNATAASAAAPKTPAPAR